MKTSFIPYRISIEQEFPRASFHGPHKNKRKCFLFFCTGESFNSQYECRSEIYSALSIINSSLHLSTHKNKNLKSLILNASFLPYKISRIQNLLGALPLDYYQGFALYTMGASGWSPDPLPKSDSPSNVKSLFHP